MSSAPMLLRLVLGSSSPYRAEILRAAGQQFIVRSPSVDEDAIATPDPWLRSMVLARIKAEVLLPSMSSDEVLIAADQVSFVGDEMREKPRDAEMALRYLRTLHLQPVRCISAIVVARVGYGPREGIDISSVVFDEVSEELALRIIAEGEVYRWGGGFSVQHPLLAPQVRHLDGDRTGVQGLPVCLTRALLGSIGYLWQTSQV